jgi:hypothetical protein
MRRVYLEEDIQLIRKYFPGARTVALRTPFDLTTALEDPWKLRRDPFQDETGAADPEWYGDLLWNQ